MGKIKGVTTILLFDSMNLNILDTEYGFPCGSAGKESARNAGELGSISGLGRFPWRRERLRTPVFWPGEFHRLYSPWIIKSQTQLSDFHYLNTLFE